MAINLSWFISEFLWLLLFTGMDRLLIPGLKPAFANRKPITIPRSGSSNAEDRKSTQAQI